MSFKEKINKFVESEIKKNMDIINKNNLDFYQPKHIQYTHCIKNIYANQNQKEINNHVNNVKKKQLLSQFQIDLLELLQPNLPPQVFLQNILNLFKKQQELNLKQKAPKKNQNSLLKLQSKAVLNLLINKQIIEQQQYEQDELNQKIQNIRILKNKCYEKLGRMITHKQIINNSIELTKTNYYTREYLLPVVKQKIENLQIFNAQNHIRKYYIKGHANSRGIYFQTQNMPKNLNKIIEKNQFKQIMCTINEIIQKTVYKYKSESAKNTEISPIYKIFWIIFILFLSFLSVNALAIKSEIFQIFTLMVSLCLMLFIIVYNCHRFKQQISHVSLIDQINIKIMDFFTYLNSRVGINYQWRTQKNLYWLEIEQTSKSRKESQYIKKRARYEQICIMQKI